MKDYNEKKNSILSQLEKLKLNLNMNGVGILKNSKNKGFFPTELFLINNKK